MTETKSKQILQDDELLTPEETVAGLKLPSRDWLYQRIHSDTLPFPYVKVGHYLRFPLSGLRKYIASQTKVSA